MAREIQVTYLARYVTTVKVEDGQTVWDAIADISIPEDAVSSYVEDSFDVSDVRENDKRVPHSEW